VEAQAAALAAAARTGDVPLVDVIVAKTGLADPKLASAALVAACEHGHVPLVRSLLALCPRLKANPAMLRAARRGHRDVVCAVIESGRADMWAGVWDGPFGDILPHFVAADLSYPPPDLTPVLDALRAAGASNCLRTQETWRAAGRYGSIPLINYIMSLRFRYMELKFVALAIGACEGGHIEAVRHVFALAERDRLPLRFHALGRSDWYLKLAPAVMRFLLERYEREVGFFTRGRSGPVARTDLLLCAVRCGSRSLLATALRHDADGKLLNNKHKVEVGWDNGCRLYAYRTILSFVADAGIAEELLKAGAAAAPETGRKSKFPYISVLKEACLRASPDAVRALLAAGAGVEVDGDGRAPLRYVLEAECGAGRVADKLAVMNLLLDADADPLDVGDERSALHVLVSLGDVEGAVEAARLLLAKVPELLEHESVGAPRTNEFGEPLPVAPAQTALLEAVGLHDCSVAVVEALLDAGADVGGLYEGKTPILASLAKNEKMSIPKKRDILLLLLRAGADPLAVDEDGAPPAESMEQHGGGYAGAILAGIVRRHVSANAIIGSGTDTSSTSTAAEPSLRPISAPAPRKVRRVRAEDDVKDDEESEEKERPRKRRRSVK
jgi:hypothetical protein